MKNPKYCVGATILGNQFILVIGGRTSEQMNYLTDCECYDTESQTWFDIASLPSQDVKMI